MPTALVTGASRGVGRGVANSLAQSGFKVFATGRNVDAADLARPVVRIRCDHLRDNETEAAFARVADEAGTLDLLVNNAWGGYESMVENGKFTWSAPFWEQPAHRWTSMMDGGVRAAFVASLHSARIMVANRRGLIVNISFWATDKMTSDMAHELRPHGVAVVSLYPGLVRTEAVMEAAACGWLDLTNSESPEFIGRVIAALAQDPAILDRSGKVLVAAQAALELGVQDIDGRQPIPLTRESV